ncbi:MAG: hypothetical protein ABSC42_11180 [Tepidisphaeraceae bacterium]
MLRVPISVETEVCLKARAAAAGVDVETYAARQLELLAKPGRSVKELSGPIAGEFARGGMSDAELSDFLEVEKHAMRAERGAKHQK